MQKVVFVLALVLLIAGGIFFSKATSKKPQEVLSSQFRPSYWLMLHRKSNVEYLYLGIPGQKEKSEFIKKFTVKVGMPDRPTPLPQLMGRDYWIITSKEDASDNPETAPYFITLDVPVSQEEPFGPTPYNECNGQCNWQLPGHFGLHGINGDTSKLSKEDPGSSGCIRHSDEDIVYLYTMLEPQKEEIRYYIEDI